MTSEAARDEARDFSTPHFPSDPDAPTLDCETAALMRGWLRPLVDQAAGWPAFIEALSTRGYGLVFRQGRLWLIVNADPSAPGAWEAAQRRLDQLEHRLRAGSTGYGLAVKGEPVDEADFRYGFTREAFQDG